MSAQQIPARSGAYMITPKSRDLPTRVNMMAHGVSSGGVISNQQPSGLNDLYNIRFGQMGDRVQMTNKSTTIPRPCNNIARTRQVCMNIPQSGGDQKKELK